MWSRECGGVRTDKVPRRLSDRTFLPLPRRMPIMAQLEPGFSLMDVQPGDAWGIRGFQDAASSSSWVVVTTNRRLFVWDISSRRLSRSFVASEKEEFFTTSAFIAPDQDGGTILVEMECFDCSQHARFIFWTVRRRVKKRSVPVVWIDGGRSMSVTESDLRSVFSPQHFSFTRW